ncbi:poly(3-hydroxybutyrate) depolymerase [Variovorax beijingensis]|uniref:Poly(3-hydroxybutyrate) depolymerase n=1 Tax=Variovorax beijingensis TaxID=2496117 RepID=A0A561BBF4_9BURK|nr:MULTISPECIES: PHB depolymerase family esterase [Variovorax]MDR6456531.1 poly(3-hydroxybutyrate) depolymerase [Variovorax paradoxus]TWD76241.1 poly(3-hydroxybutyrate) depolymerase [Variovorax beijingensis]
MKKFTMLAAASVVAAGCGGGGSNGYAFIPAPAAPPPAQATVTDDCAAVPGAAAAAPSSAALPLVLQTIKVNGEDRQYYEYAPRDVAALRDQDARGVEVVVSLHRAGQSAEDNARLTGWPTLAEEKGFVAIFPVAKPTGWNTAKDTARSDDHAFIVAAAAAVRTRYGLPSTMSTFLTGAGSGGVMAQELAMRELGVMATGVASFGAAAEPATLNLPAESLPRTAMAVWQFQCGADPFAKQTGFWRQANATDAQNQQAVGDLPTVTDFVKDNPVQQVRLSRLDRPAESPAISRLVWEELFGKVVRFPDNKSYNGTLHAEKSIADMGLTETIKSLRPGEPRRWLTYVPPQYQKLVAEGKKLPLLFSFHGRNGSARFQAEISEWHDVARDEGFIVVYPHGLKATWTTSIDADNPDVQFFLDLLEEMKRTYQIDDGRVFLNGSSQGTALTNRIAVQYPQLFAAIAPCYSGHLSAASYANPIVRTDIALPVWQCRGEQELPSEFPGGTAGETAARTFWRETVNQNFSSPAIAIDGRRTTEIWNSGRAEYRWQITSDIGHAWHPGQARKMWDEMLKRYRRNPDGSLQRL